MEDFTGKCDKHCPLSRERKKAEKEVRLVYDTL
jgi:predicted secreted Zn-dependent protease